MQISHHIFTIIDFVKLRNLRNILLILLLFTKISVVAQSVDPEVIFTGYESKELVNNCESDIILYVDGETEIGGIYKGSFSNLVEMLLSCVEPDSLGMHGSSTPFTSGMSRLEAVSCGFPVVLIPIGGEMVGMFKGGLSNDYFVACLEKPSLIDVNLPIYQGGRSYLEIVSCFPGMMLGGGTLFVGSISREVALSCEYNDLGDGTGMFFGGNSKDYFEFDVCFELIESFTGENLFAGGESSGIAEDCENETMLGDEPLGGYYRGGDSGYDNEFCYIPPCLDLQPAVITSLGVVPVCVGQTITLQASQAVTYQWQYRPFLGTWTNFATTDIIAVGSTHEGEFRFIGYGSDPNCVDTSAVFTALFVDEIPKPIITVEGSNVLCVGGAVALRSSPAEAYLWSDGSTTQTIWVTQSGNYTVTITDINGCQATSTITTITDGLNIAPTAIIDPSGTIQLCYGAGQLLTSILSEGYVWSTGETTQSIYVTETGKYTVRISDINGCEATADSVEIIVHHVIPEILYPEGLTICYGAPITLEIEPQTGTIQWYKDNIAILGETDYTLQTNVAGFYHATLDTLGCTFDAIAVSIVSNNTTTPLANITPSHPVLCEGSNITLTADDAESYEWSTGENSKSIIVQTPGKYILTVEDSFGCLSSDSIVIIEVPIIIQPEIQITMGQLELCNDTSTVTLYVTDGVAWLWSNGETTQSITVGYSDADFYSATAYCLNGCAVNVEGVEVVAVLPITPIIDAGIANICGSEPVIIHVSPVDPSYTYEWNTLDTDEYIEVSVAGTYSVTIITADGCRFTSAPVTITQSPAPATPLISVNLPFTILNDTVLVCPNQLNNQAVLTSTVASEYLWNTGDDTQSISISTIGKYALMVTYANGCTAISDTIIVELKDDIVYIETEDNITQLCPGGSIEMTIVGADVGSTYRWFKDDILQTGEVLVSLIVDTPGSYHAEVSGLGGCVENTEPVDITNYPTIPPVITAAADLYICPYDSVRLTVTPNIDYLWTWIDGSDSIQVGTSQYIYASEAGEYLVVVTDQFGCVQETSVNITVKPEYHPLIDATEDVICQGEIVTLSVIPTPPIGSTYLWNTGETTPTIDFDNPLIFGNQTYWVEVTYPEGCTFRTPIKNIYVNMTPRQPEITIVGSNSVCPDMYVSLIATKSDLYTYQWRWETSPGVWENYPDGQTFGIVVDQNGNYEVTITDQNGCSNTSDVSELETLSSATVEIYPQGPVSLCELGGIATLTASQPDVRYFWSPTGETTQSIIVTQPGFYRVKIYEQISDGVECEVESKRVEVIDPSTWQPAIINAIGSTTFCEGGSVTINSSPSPNGVYAWHRWSTSDSTIVGNMQQLIVTESGAYVMVFTDNNNCKVYSNIIRVTVHPLPEAVISPSGVFTVCQGEYITLSAPDVSGYTYQWSAPSNATTRVIEAYAGTYTVTITTEHGCSATSLPVIVQETAAQAPIPDAGDDMVCQGEMATLIATSTIIDPEFMWWDAPVGGNLLWFGDTFVTPVLNSQYKVWVSVQSDLLCESDRLEVTVSIGVNIVFSNVPTTICHSAPSIAIDVLPPDGVLTGKGVTGLVFDPYDAGVGDHWLVYTICNEKDSVMITVFVPEFDIDVPDNVCGGETVNMLTWITSSDPLLSYTFYENDQITVIINPGNVLIPDEGATWYVQASDSEGCMSEMKPIIIPAKKQTGPIYRRPNLE